MNAASARPGALSVLAPLAFVAGLALLCFTLFILGVSANESGVTELGDHQLTTHNGTATLAYPVPLVFRAQSTLEGAFRFPADPGTMMIVGCYDYDRVARGDPAILPAERMEGAREGRFSFSTSQLYFGAPGFQAEPGERPFSRVACADYFVVYQWPIGPDGDVGAGRPEVDMRIRTTPLDGEAGFLLALFGAAGTLLAGGGAVAWGRRLAARRPLEPADDEESAAETLLRVLERTGGWLERTRRSLLLAGVLGVFLWYPVLVPWAWSVGARASARPWAPWVLAGAALALLVALTVVWAREYMRLDKQLVAWRDRMDRLREREARLLSGPDADG